MKKATLLLLVALVGVLLWLRREREHADEGIEQGLVHVYDHALLAPFEPERVSGVWIDNLERGEQMKFERGAAGVWFMVDPLPCAARSDVFVTLIDGVARARGTLDLHPDPRALSLDPPLIVLELEQELDGGVRTDRIEIGALDVDPRRVNVRVPGHPAAPPGEDAAVLRVGRPLYTLLDRPSDAFRDPRVVQLAGGSAVAFVRRGRASPEPGAEPIDLALEAERGAAGWRRVDGPDVTLDPISMGLLVRGAIELSATSFHDGVRPAELASFGLDPPRFTIELTDETGDRVTLLVGRPADREGTAADWVVSRPGLPHVYEISQRDAYLLARPADSLYDYAVLRVLRDEVSAVELTADGRTLVLTRAEHGWTVHETEDEARRYPAAPEVVADVLGRLEQTQLGEYAERASFAPVEPPLAVSVLLRSGVRLGGQLGSASEGEAGDLLWRRTGDELAARAPDALEALCRLPLDRARSAWIVHVDPPSAADELRFHRGGDERVYVRVEDDWFLEGEPRAEAPRDFLATVVDPLLALRAEAWDAPAPPESAPRVRAIVRGGFGPEIALAFVRGAGGEALCALPEGGFARVAPELLERLLRLFPDAAPR